MSTASWWAPFATIAVGLLNVALNVLVQKAAGSQRSWSELFSSSEFLIAFLVGCLSFAALFTLYASRIHLGRAILLMGAVSIVGGTLYAIATTDYRPTVTESILLLSIAGLFTYRLLTS